MKTKLVEIQRRSVGIQVLAGGKAIPQARLVYEVTMSDGSTRVTLGRAIVGIPGFDCLNGTSKQKKEAQSRVRPDLLPCIQAIAVLQSSIEAACLAADEIDAPKLDWASRLERRNAEKAVEKRKK
jgi:hypothetical protein